jgi:hypothetical protein
MKRISVLLTMVLLIAGVLGCVSVPETDAPISYTLNILSTAGGSVTATVDGEETVVGPSETEVISGIPAGTDVGLAAGPGGDHEFVEWLGAPVDGVSSPVTVINMQDDCEITAVFQELPPMPTYELIMAVSPSDSGTATDETNAGPYLTGTMVSIKAVPNMGYGFVSWTAPAGEFDNPGAREAIFTMPGQNVTITANFEQIPL